MSKDWEFINRKYATKLLIRIIGDYDSRFSNLQEECLSKLQEVSGYCIEYEPNITSETLKSMLEYYRGNPEIEIDDKTRELANQILDNVVEYIKKEITRDKVNEITNKLLKE